MAIIRRLLAWLLRSVDVDVDLQDSHLSVVLTVSGVQVWKWDVQLSVSDNNPRNARGSVSH